MQIFHGKERKEMTKEEITIEELSLRAWPAFESARHEGWILRQAEGLTKRANSVIPLYEGEGELEAKVSFCEDYYKKAGLKSTFKLTEFSEPPALDSFLAERGYSRVDETSVRTAAPCWREWQASARVELRAEAGEEWLSEAARIKGYNEHDDRVHRRIIGGVSGEKGFALLRDEEGRVNALGFALLDGGYLSFHDIFVEPACRQRGLATELMESLLCWGVNAGAEKSFLQVVADNRAAIALYEKFGFKELYRYWYRVK